VQAALAELRVPVLLVAGEYDVALPPSRAAEYADLFPGGRLVVQPGAGHFPWQDDLAAFVRAVGGPPPPHPARARDGAREGAGDTGGR
jgi:pimeloyl-ACP methyl ester carboxylesterase